MMEIITTSWINLPLKTKFWQMFCKFLALRKRVLAVRMAIKKNKTRAPHFSHHRSHKSLSLNWVDAEVLEEAVAREART
jgi:hypothetical protein